jgi:tight adherence protein C
MSSLVSAVMPWMLGVAWGTLAATPLVTFARRRALSARASRLRPGIRTRSGRAGRLVQTGLRRTGPLGRVVNGLVGRRRTRKRDGQLAADLPVTIDVLSVAVAAGCTPYLAVDVAARWSPLALSTPLFEVLHSSSLGVGFAEALDDLAVGTPRLRALANALLVADRTGAPVAPALERLAAEERSELRRRAEARARQVPVRLLFPLVFLVLPAFGLLTVVPALLAGFGRS